MFVQHKLILSFKYWEQEEFRCVSWLLDSNCSEHRRTSQLCFIWVCMKVDFEHIQEVLKRQTGFRCLQALNGPHWTLLLVSIKVNY